MKLLKFIGFVICPEKLNCAPTKCIEYYDFVLSSEDMALFLSDEKEENPALSENPVNFIESGIHQLYLSNQPETTYSLSKHL